MPYQTSGLRVHPTEFWTSIEAIENIYERKRCIADARGDCQGKVISAHTIPRSMLEKIAIDGHVYSFKGTARDLLRNDGQYVVEKRGIGQFSILNFFCASHDREIFSHLENDELVFDSHQLALLHYRAMGAELYKKINVRGGVQYQIAQEEMRGGSQHLDDLRAFEAGQTLGVRDMSQTFPKCEALLVGQDYDDVNALIVWFKKMPSILTVGGFSARIRLRRPPPPTARKGRGHLRTNWAFHLARATSSCGCLHMD